MSSNIIRKINYSLSYDGIFEEFVRTLKENSSYRHFMELERLVGQFPQATAYKHDSQELVSIWCSNDVLGMGQNSIVIEAMKQALDKFGSGSGGSRNLAGNTHLHILLEKEMAELHNKPASLVFNSGYIANFSTLASLPKILPGCIYFSDEKNHASIIEGIRHSKAEKHIFRHNDPVHLEYLLKQTPTASPKIVVFESVYSMEGDIAPIHQLCDIAEKYNALTYIDEVHSIGIYGLEGKGLAQQSGTCDKISIIQGCFSKAYGVSGGYIVGSSSLVDCIRSVANGFIFTTSLPPCIVAGALASVRYLKKSDTERAALYKNIDALKDAFSRDNIPFMNTQSHIIPVMVGNAERCKKMSQALIERYKICLPPVNFPTVPVGAERFRVLPTSTHTQQDIENISKALKEVFKIYSANGDTSF